MPKESILTYKTSPTIIGAPLKSFSSTVLSGHSEVLLKKMAVRCSTQWLEKFNQSSQETMAFSITISTTIKEIGKVGKKKSTP